MELTILMPCLNEAKTIAGCIHEAQAFIRRSKVEAEILVADNGSSDGSIQIARQAGARVVKVQQKGDGNALRKGIEAAKGDYVIMADSDMSYDLDHLETFLKALREENGLVMVNRFKGGIEKGAMPFLHYYIGVPILSLLGRMIFRVPIGDFHCGLRGVDRKAFLSLDIHAEGMEFATEMIGAFARSSYSIAELPTSLKKDGRGKKSHLRTFRDGLRHLAVMAKMMIHK